MIVRVLSSRTLRQRRTHKCYTHILATVFNCWTMYLCTLPHVGEEERCVKDGVLIQTRFFLVPLRDFGITFLNFAKIANKSLGPQKTIKRFDDEPQ